MNTSHYMDKQIMDLSNSQRTSDFIDLINSHDADRVGGDGGAASNKDEILPSYDFQPLRPVGVSQLSNIDSGNHNGARVWSSVDSKINSSNRNYTSLESIEPGKLSVEEDHNGYNETLVSEIDRRMKKHADNLLHALEGVSARITQLETRTRHMENSVDDLKLSVGNNQGITDGKLRQLENILREVQTDVEVVKDKQEIIEAQLNLSKLHIPKVDPQPETQNNAPPVTASAPLQSLHHHQPPPAALTQPPTYTPQPATLPNLHQYSPNQNPPRDPYYTPPPPPSSSEPPTQHFQAPPPQQYPPPPPLSELPSQHFQAPPPQQQYPPPPQYSQPPLPQPQNPLPHQPEEAPYSQSQNYRQQPPGGAPPYPQPLYGYDPPPPQLPAARPAYGSGEQFSYGGPQYGSGSPRKSQQLVPSGGGSGYPQLPTARILPHAIPTATGVGSGSGSGGGVGGTGSPSAGNRVPIDDVVDRVTNMGFPRDHVRATVRKLTENGQAVDLNVVLDKLMNEGVVGGGGDNPQRGWFGR